MLNGSLADWAALGIEGSLVDVLCEDLDKCGGVDDTSEVNGYAHPAEEGLSLNPIGGVFLAD